MTNSTVKKVTLSSTNTDARLIVSSTQSSTGRSFTVEAGRTTPKRAVKTGRKKVENAVFAHIQAVRALGHKTINTVEIADSLGLSPEVVMEAVTNLKRKGVRIGQ
jgi:hypothetical protein